MEMHCQNCEMGTFRRQMVQVPAGGHCSSGTSLAIHDSLTLHPPIPGPEPRPLSPPLTLARKSEITFWGR